MIRSINLIPRSERLDLLPCLNPQSDAERDVINQYLQGSTCVWAAEVDDNIICVFGIVTGTLICSAAYLWFIDTPALDRYKFVFARHSKEVIDEILTQYPLIIGHCVRTNPDSQRWLKWLGAKFTSPVGELVPFEIGKP